MSQESKKRSVRSRLLLVVLAVILVSVLSSIAFAADYLVRVSTDSSGGQSNNSAWISSINADGRYIVFSSAASNLVPGDTNSMEDVFRKDVLAGTIERASTDSSGLQASGGNSWGPSVSSDGRYVVFTSDASNLVAGDTNGAVDIFRKDLETGDIVRVSTDLSGLQANSSSRDPSVSSDGRYVAFDSHASNLVPGDSNLQVDVFRKDLQTGAIVRVSVDSSGIQANSDSDYPSVSSDGRYVVFTSSASNLVADDTNGANDIFRRDLQTGATVRVSVDSSGVQGDDNSGGIPSLSSDGRYIAFGSGASNLVPGDTNGSGDVFRKDLQTGALLRVSVDSSGAQGNGVSDGPSMSSDGRYIAFGSSASNLVAGDTNLAVDVFRKDLQTGALLRVSVDSSGAQGNGISSDSSISSDGRYIAFSSSGSNLVSGDTNGVPDIFRADLTLYPASSPPPPAGGGGSSSSVPASSSWFIISTGLASLGLLWIAKSKGSRAI